MTVNEAVERIKEMYFMCDDFYNCKYGHDCTNGCSEAVKMATKALEKLKVGKDNMVISSSDLMTILNSDSEELKQYKEVGTVEELQALKEKSVEKLAEEYKICYKSCTECEAYDKEKHHCPKFCYIIAETVKEIEENQNVWIPTSERLPEKNAIVLTCDKDGWISVKVNMPYAGVKNDFESGYYTAWMPLPPAYVPKEGRE